MPLDGTVLSSVIKEISVLEGGRIDKISQPEKDEILLFVRAKGQNHKLLLTATASSPRLCFTSAGKSNPMQAPMFCMVLRKHLSGGRIAGIFQPDFDRIAEVYVESSDEMGDKSIKRLIIEIMGKHSNILLVNSAGKVLEAIKHVPLAISRQRPILPGVIYEKPPGKLDPTKDLQSNVIKSHGGNAQQSLYKNFNGISPILASDICLKSGVEPDKYASELNDNEIDTLLAVLRQAVFAADKNPADGHEKACNCIYYNDKGKAVDFSAFPLSVYKNYTHESYVSPSECLEAFYSSRDIANRVSQKTADLRKLVSSHAERARKKSFVFEKTRDEIKNRDNLRVIGELITAYLYMIKKGDEKLVCENFYDNNNIIEIKLDKDLTPPENAQRYFKQYNKQKRTHEALQEQIAKNQEDIRYFESVQTFCEQDLTEIEINEIRAELAELGYAKRKNVSKKPAKPSKPLEFTLDGGFRAYVGKNNQQNDFLTLRFAKPNDIWLHTKDIAGSHVILVTEGKTVPDSVLLQAAKITAYYSKARQSSNVPVDYVAKKHVKKPNGAKPGYVIYDNHKTLFVTPEEPKHI